MPNDIALDSRPVEQIIEQSAGPDICAFQAGAPISAIVPRTLGELAMVATAVIKAGLAPDSYTVEPKTPLTDETKAEAHDQTKARIMIGIMKGAEVGLPPITALSTIAIINNRPCIWGDGAVALVQSRGLIERYEESFEGEERTSAPVKDEYGTEDYAPNLRDFPDNLTAVFRIWRHGHALPYEGRFSVRDAKRAHLWNNPKRRPWIEYPKRMLKMRARTYPLRDGFADCLMGLAIREEVEDLPTEAPTTDTSFLDDAPITTQAVSAPPSEEARPITTEIAESKIAALAGPMAANDRPTAKQVAEVGCYVTASSSMPAAPAAKAVASSSSGKEERNLVGGAEPTPARASIAVEDQRNRGRSLHRRSPQTAGPQGGRPGKARSRRSKN